MNMTEIGKETSFEIAETCLSSNENIFQFLTHFISLN